MRKILNSLVVGATIAASFLPAATKAYGPDVTGWAASTFTGVAAPPLHSAPSLILRRQDYGHLQINKSVMETPLGIGQRQYSRGLGTHANSEIVISNLDGSAKTFRALVGVDGIGTRVGSVEFMVEVNGANLFHSPTLRGGDDALPVEVSIPDGVKEIVLKVDTTPDGPSFDHADWAMAQLALKDGSTLWLDDLATQAAGDFWPDADLPFSFVYDGNSSRTFLSQWHRESASAELPDRSTWQTRWTDPQTGLQVTADATAFKDFPAVEWLLHFKNTGSQDSPILEKVQALDLSLPARPENHVILDTINGDNASERSFVPVESDLACGQTWPMEPVGGRPSNYTFPMFDLQNGSRGVFAAIGWTGEWAGSLARSAAGPVQVRTGMKYMRLFLHPGETIRSPRILLFSWSGDRMEAHNDFRRLLLTHYLPKVDGRVPDCAIAAQSFNEGPPDWGTEAGQIKCAKINRDLGCDTLWMDAGWFEGGFPSGTGNWFPSKSFPNGMGPVGQECEKLGLKFLMWYEPERVSDHTEIAKDHESFVLHDNPSHGDGGLFNLGDPAARRWLTDLIVKQIKDFHMHTYRNDFNMDPLPFWLNNDPTNRLGITEIRYVEGLYDMWDEMRAKYPHMYMDDCASGGRRIDLEMISRSLVQTRSDAAVAPGRSDWHQSQTYGLNLFLPVHATIGWETGPYECRSAATSGFCGEWDILNPRFAMDEAKASIAEINENRKYWSGDYYPLTSWTMSADRWLAWQLHRRDLDEGIVLAFRHADCPYSALQVNLRGLKSDSVYEVEFIDESRQVTKKSMTGKKLAGLELKIPNAHQSVLVRYKWYQKNPQPMKSGLKILWLIRQARTLIFMGIVGLILYIFGMIPWLLISVSAGIGLGSRHANLSDGEYWTLYRQALLGAIWDYRLFAMIPLICILLGVCLIRMCPSNTRISAFEGPTIPADPEL